MRHPTRPGPPAPAWLAAVHPARAPAPLLAILVVLLMAMAPVVEAASTGGDDAPASMSYLAGLHAASDTGTLAPYIVEAAVAQGLDAAAWPDADDPALDRVELPAEDAGLMPLLRPAHALAVAGVDLRAGPWGDVEGRLRGHFRDGQFGSPDAVNDDMWALLTLRASGTAADDPMVVGARDAILAARNASGAWAWGRGVPPDVDSAAMAVETLAAVGAAPEDGLEWIRAQQSVDGGYPLWSGGQSNCDSTVWAIRAHLAMGVAAPEGTWAFLATLRQADGGYAYLPGTGSAGLCTAEVARVLGEAGRTETEAQEQEAAGPPGLGAVVVVGAAVLVRCWRRPP